MRFLVSVFLLLGVIGYANADAAYNTAEAEQVVASVSDMGDELRADYDALIEKVRAINPKIVKKIEKQAKSDDAKISMLRSYLARETFEYYKNKFMSDLKQRSRETGRKIRHEDFDSKVKPKEGPRIKNSEEHYWLDRGELDEKKCRKDGWMICPWPDGFEEFFIQIQETFPQYSKKDVVEGSSEHFYKISIERDRPQEGYNLRCDITLEHRSRGDIVNGGYDDTYTLAVYCNTYDYVDMHNWRNYLVDDVLAGAFDVVSVEKLPEGSPFGERLYVPRRNENPDAWKSSTFPGGHVLGKDFEHSISVSKK